MGAERKRGRRLLDDDQLLAGLSALVKRENDCLSDLLAHLAELDERGVCVALGYSSLFAYCTDELGFCKSSAGRRIAAARVCREFPDAFARVAKGDLQLSVLCALRPHLTADNASELFVECSRQSYEQVELLLAARFPRPDVRDLVRRLPTPAMTTPDIGSKELETSSREMESSGSLEKSAPKPAPCGIVKPLSAERFSVNFTADIEFRELLEEVRALLSHSEPKGDLMRVMQRGLEALRSELLKKRFGVGRKPRRLGLRVGQRSVASESATGPAPSAKPKPSRHVPAAVAREVYRRDTGRCTFQGDDGHRCDEQRLLQLDHVTPYAEGGEATVANLRLRCRAHNLHTARVHFGKQHVYAAMRARASGNESQSYARPQPKQPSRNSPWRPMTNDQ